MSPNVLTAVAAAGIIVAAMALGARELLLRSSVTTTPNARAFVHIAMSICFVTLFLRGSSLAFGLMRPHPVHVDVGAAVSSWVLACYFITMVVDLLLDRMPSAAWARLHRAKTRFLYLSRCGPSKSPLAIMAAEGATVVGPMELPEDVPGMMRRPANVPKPD